jgi:hypothetical protein
MISRATTHLNIVNPFIFGRDRIIAPVSTDPSLTIWYDIITSNLNNSAPPAADGTYITSWTDKSATAHDANASGNTSVRPRYYSNIQNGLGAIYFDGVNDAFTVNPFTSIQSIAGYTYFIVGKTNSVSKQQTISVMKASGAGDVNELFLQIGSTGVIKVGAAGATATSSTTDTNYHIHTLVFDGSQTGNANRLKHRLDGVEKTLTFTGTVGTTANASTTYLYFGTDTSNNNDFDGYISSIIVYTKALSLAEIQNVERYLKNLYATP